MTGEQPSAYSELRRRAKKSHRCCECGREIAAALEEEWLTGAQWAKRETPADPFKTTEARP